MDIACDRCRGGYDTSSGAAVARVFVEDSQCNHVELRCPHCGCVEVVFLGPRRLERLLDDGTVPVRVAARADRRLRAHATRTWASVARRATEPAAPVPGPPPAPPARVTSRPLDARQEELLTRFGRVLDTIPDDLFWDLLDGDPGR